MCFAKCHHAPSGLYMNISKCNPQKRFIFLIIICLCAKPLLISCLNWFFLAPAPSTVGQPIAESRMKD